MSYKCDLVGVNFIKPNDWTFLNGFLKANLFHFDNLYLIKDENAKPFESIINVIKPDSKTTKSVSMSSKLFTRTVDLISMIKIFHLFYDSFGSSKPVCTSNDCTSKPVCIVIFVQGNLFVLVIFVQIINLLVPVMIIQVNLFILLMFVQVNLCVQVMFVQLNLFVLVMFV